MNLLFYHQKDKSPPQDIFEQIVTDNYQRVYKYCCYRLNYNHEAAKDCTQETFLTLYQSFADLNDLQHIKAWLYRTADNYIHRTVQEAARKLKHEVTIDDEFECNSLSYDIDLEQFEKINIDLLVKSILNALTEEEFSLYKMFYRNKKSVYNIAMEMNLSYSAVTTRIYRLKKKILYLMNNILETDGREAK